MRKIKNIVLPLIVFATIIVASGYTKSEPKTDQKEMVSFLENKENQTINLFVTHGHCSTPFAGVVNDLKLDIPSRDDLGNPLEDMKISFEVDPNTFNVCRAEN